jgi:hypothetical protein
MTGRSFLLQTIVRFYISAIHYAGKHLQSEIQIYK